MQYRFTSAPFIHAPGFVASMRRVGSLDKKAAAAAATLYMLANTYPAAPAWALLALVEGKYTVDGDTVVVTGEGVALDG